MKVFLTCLVVVAGFISSELYTEAGGRANVLVGAPSQIDPEQLKDVQMLSEYAVTQENTQSGDLNSTCKRYVKRVTNATSQVVAGVRYKIQLEICVPDSCEKEGLTNPCQNCTLDIVHQSWTGVKQINSFACGENA